MRDLTIWT